MGDLFAFFGEWLMNGAICNPRNDNNSARYQPWTENAGSYMSSTREEPTRHHI